MSMGDSRRRETEKKKDFGNNLMHEVKRKGEIQEMVWEKNSRCTHALDVNSKKNK